MSAFYAAVTGVLYTYFLGIANYEQFQLGVSIDYLAMIIIGGLGSVLGSIFGAVFITLLPIVIRTMTGAGFSTGGQHSDYLEAWFAHTAGIKVVAPSNPEDAYGLMRAAIDDPDPVLFIENLPTYWTPHPVEKQVIPIGKAKVAREGSDVTVIGHSLMIVHALAVAEKLAGEGISVEVVDLRTISPWDRETVLASAKKTGRALVVHEAVKQFGIGAEIASVINEELWGQLKAPVKRLGAAFAPVPFSKPLETAFVPQPADIEAAIRALVA